MIREAVEADFNNLDSMLLSYDVVTDQIGLKKFTSIVDEDINGIKGFFTVDWNKKLLVHFAIHKNLKQSERNKCAWRLIALVKKILGPKFFVCLPIRDKKLNALLKIYWPLSRLISKQRSDWGNWSNIYLVEV